MVNEWNTERRERITPDARAVRGTSSQVLSTSVAQVGFDRALGLALWIGLVAVMLWVGTV